MVLAMRYIHNDISPQDFIHEIMSCVYLDCFLNMPSKTVICLTYLFTCAQVIMVQSKLVFMHPCCSQLSGGRLD